jgi:protein required for attachment to host cells
MFEPREKLMILQAGAIVAVIDGEQMKLFRNSAHEPKIELVVQNDVDLRIANVGSGGRHRSTTANPDRSRQREDNFAAAAAGYLNQEALAGRIDQLVIVADPRTLGEMRKHFHDALLGKILRQLDRDLTGHPVQEIQAALVAA